MLRRDDLVGLSEFSDLIEPVDGRGLGEDTRGGVEVPRLC